MVDCLRNWNSAFMPSISPVSLFLLLLFFCRSARFWNVHIIHIIYRRARMELNKIACSLAEAYTLSFSLFPLTSLMRYTHHTAAVPTTVCADRHFCSSLWESYQRPVILPVSPFQVRSFVFSPASPTYVYVLLRSELPLLLLFYCSCLMNDNLDQSLNVNCQHSRDSGYPRNQSLTLKTRRWPPIESKWILKIVSFSKHLLMFRREHYRYLVALRLFFWSQSSDENLKLLAARALSELKPNFAAVR